MRPIEILRLGPAAAVGGASSITFNSADKAAGAELLESDKRMRRLAGLNQWASGRGTVSHDAGDAGGFYLELQVVDGSGDGVMLGLGTSAASIIAGAFPGSDSNGHAYYGNGNRYTAGSWSNYGATYTTGDNIGILLKNGKVYFRKNGSWQNSADVGAETGEAFSGLTGQRFPFVGVFTGGTSSVRAINRIYSLPAGAADW